VISPPPWSIEACTAASRPEWLALRRALWPDCDEAEHHEETTAQLADGVRYLAALARADDGTAIGLVEAALRQDHVNGTDGSPVAFLEGLYVVPDWRRQGVARALVDAAAAWARERGSVELASDTPLTNLRSQAVHRHLGFVETERVVYFLRRLDGRVDSGDINAGIAPLRLQTARLFVRDLARALDFYRDRLGLSLVAGGAEAGWCVFDAGGLTLVVEPVPADAPAEDQGLVGRFTGLSFTVDDVRATHAALVARGVVFSGAPEAQGWGGVIATLRDPDGNELQIAQMP
jgi:aminoglycoside 6'-N-acetyltransferase I